MVTQFMSSRRSFVPALLVFLFAVTGCGKDTSPTSPTATTFQLTGRVVEAAAGTSLTGATLTVVDGPNAGKQATTGGDGRYTLPNLIASAFTLRVQHVGYLDYAQDVTITSDATIDVRLTFARTLNSGWVGGEFLVTFDGERISTRVTTAQVTQNGAAVSGRFTGADGSSGTLTGRVGGTQFVGSMGVEFVSGSRHCRGTAANVTGAATGDIITLGAPSVALETCSGAATDLQLTLTP